MTARAMPAFMGVLAAFVAAVAADPPAGRTLPPGAVARLGGTGLRHADRPTCVAFSPDGTHVVTGGQDDTVRVWSVATGRQLAITYFNRFPRSVQYTHDGNRLAVNTLDGYVRYLHPDTLAETGSVLAPTLGLFTLSPDSRLTAARDTGDVIRVDELDASLAKLELPKGPAFAFHPGSKQIAAADKDGGVTVYQVTGGKPLFTATHGGELNGLAFRPDGRAIASAAVAGKVKVWELGKPEPLAEIDATGPVVFVGNGRLAAVRTAGIGVYDFAAKAWVHEVAEAAGAFAVSPDGTKLAAVGTGGTRVRIWDLPAGRQLHADDDEFPDPALIVPWPDGRGLFLVAGERGYLWPADRASATPAATFPGAVTAAAAGGVRLAVVTPNGLYVWDDFDPKRPLPAKPSRAVVVPGKDVRAVAVSPDGKLLAFGRDDRTVSLADAATGKVLRALPHQTAPLALAFTPDSGKLLLHGMDGYLRLFEIGDDADRQLWETSVPRAPRGSIAVSADGRHVAAVARNFVPVVDVATGRKVTTVTRGVEDAMFAAVGFSPDGRLVLTGTGGTTGAVQVWDVKGERLGQFSTGLGGVTRLAFFPDGTRAASAGTDEAVTVWDVTKYAAGK